MKMVEVVHLPVSQPADERATERNHRLFDWAFAVLQRIGIDKIVAQAKTIEELHGIILDLKDAEIALAVRDALHPASGDREEHFRGLREGGLKLIIKNRFNNLKKDREREQGRPAGRKQRTWDDDLILNKKGEIVPNLANLILILHEAPKWKGVLAFNTFNARVVIRKRAPWGEEAPDTPWTDHHDSLTRVAFQRDYRINPAMGDVGRAIQAAARHNAFHPVREYFDALVWDGTPRLDRWLITHLHAEDSLYIRAIGPRYLISAVARIYQPGCKVDHILVLEGPQGKQKSEALRTIAIRDEWFTDRLSHVGSKDAAQELAGVLIIEIAEMDTLTRATSSASKSFLTRRDDRFRPPYGKHLVNLLRQCVFAGTINPLAGGYLKDPTGARRYWPVACHGMIDREALEKDRDQLWAEAVQRFKMGAPWWLETPELEALATTEQAARLIVDAWKAPIEEWLNNCTDVSIPEVLEYALELPQEAWTQSAQNRVARILTHLGFVHFRPRTKRGREYRYRRKPSLGKTNPSQTDHPDHSKEGDNTNE
jgi:predicted P-loop ATPase